MSFEEAATVFYGSHAMVDDGSSAGREKAIGFSTHGRVLTVVNIEAREGRIHIISAWKATAAEAALFEEG